MTIHNRLTLPGVGIAIDRDYENETVTIHLDNEVHVLSVTVPTADFRQLIRTAGLD